MEDYTRDQFLKLLEKNFSKVDGDHRLQLSDPNLDNKDVAEALDLDASYFGTLLNPSSDSASYKTVIKRLLKYEKIKNLETQVEELEATHKVLRDRETKNKAMLFLALILSMAAIVLVIINFFWLPSKLNYTLAGYVKSQPQRFVIRDVGTLENIMQWHGKIITHHLALEAVKLNAEVKAKADNFTPADSIQILGRAIQIVRVAIQKERIYFRGLNFYTEEGANIVDVLDEVAPYDSLFTRSDPFFSVGLREVASYLVSKDKPFLDVATRVDQVVSDVQQKTWAKMEDIMFSSSK